MLNGAELYAAIRKGDLETVKTHMTEFPEQVNLRNVHAHGDQWDEITPIHCAAKFGHLDIVRCLVDLGSEVYSHPLNTYPAVAVAAWQKQTEVVRYFLEEIPDRAEGTLGVGIACNLAGRFGWTELVRRHIERDPLAVHQRGWIGDTPLHWPAHNGYIEIVRMLLEAGADPNAHEVNWIGGTPLHWASERHADIVRLLVSSGADVNAKVERPGSDHLGGTPLHWCARQKDDAGDVATLLLELGTNPDSRDAFGKTARDYAEAGERNRVLAALLRHSS